MFWSQHWVKFTSTPKLHSLPTYTEHPEYWAPNSHLVSSSHGWHLAKSHEKDSQTTCQLHRLHNWRPKLMAIATSTTAPTYTNHVVSANTVEEVNVRLLKMKLHWVPNLAYFLKKFAIPWWTLEQHLPYERLRLSGEERRQQRQSTGQQSSPPWWASHLPPLTYTLHTNQPHPITLCSNGSHPKCAHWNHTNWWEHHCGTQGISWCQHHCASQCNTYCIHCSINSWTLRPWDLSGLHLNSLNPWGSSCHHCYSHYSHTSCQFMHWKQCLLICPVNTHSHTPPTPKLPKSTHSWFWNGYTPIQNWAIETSHMCALGTYLHISLRIQIVPSWNPCHIHHCHIPQPPSDAKWMACSWPWNIYVL